MGFDSLIEYRLNSRNIPSGPYSGLSGYIVKETKNMITLRSGEVLKSLPKNCINIRFTLPACGCFISGNSLIGRPEDRVVRKSLG